MTEPIISGLMFSEFLTSVAITFNNLLQDVFQYIQGAAREPDVFEM